MSNAAATISVVDWKLDKVRQLRKDFPELSAYLDHEIAEVYGRFSELFYCSGWSDGFDAEFVAWATRAPLDAIKG